LNVFYYKILLGSLQFLS